VCQGRGGNVARDTPSGTFMSLAQELAAGVIQLIAVPLSLIGLLLSRAAADALKEQTADHLMSVARVKASEFSRWLSSDALSLELLAQRPLARAAMASMISEHRDLHAGDDPEAWAEHLTRHADLLANHRLPALREGGYTELFLLDPASGETLLSTQSTSEGRLWTAEPFLVNGVEATFIQNPCAIAECGGILMTIATPVLSGDGETVAVLAGHLDFSTVTAIFAEGWDLTSTEDTYLVNDAGRFVTEPKFGEGVVLTRGAPTEGIERALRGETGTAVYVDYRGVDVLGAFLWLDDRKLALLTEVDLEESLRAVTHMRTTIIAGGALVAFVAVGAGIASATGLVRSIRTLVAATHEIGRGNLAHRVDVKRRDEAGVLGHAFNAMADNLQRVTASRDVLGEEVTRRRKVEAELRRSNTVTDFIIETVPELFYQISEDRRFVRWSRRLREVTGYSDEEISAGSPLMFFDSEDRIRIAEAISRVFDLGEAEASADLVAKNGSMTPCPFTGRRRLIDDRPYLIGMGTDVSALKESETRLRRSMDELERSNQELERFAYVAFHDLQEPLRMMPSYTQLLDKRYGDALDQDAKDFIRYAVDGADRMRQLINDLLAFSRIESRGWPFERVDLNEVVDIVRSNLTVALDESGARLTRDAMPAVSADHAQMVSVFQNLMTNAVEFGSEDPLRIHVAVRDAGHEWVLSVLDNGIGIDPAFFDRIFILFQRLQTRTEYPGTGIGLAMCKRIVERHGGRIWVESAEGERATFSYSLPKTAKEGA